MQRPSTNDFWNTDIISGSSINYLPTPEIASVTLPVALYILGILIFIAIIVIKKYRSKEKVARAALVSFMIVGALMAVRMDYNWLRVMARDISAFSGKDIDERIATVDENDFHEFITFVREALPEGESVRRLDYFPEGEEYRQFYQMGRYYLLPALTSREGRFIWVYHKPDARYDAGRGVLYINELYSYRARPFALYKRGAALFEILGPADGVN